MEKIRQLSSFSNDSLDSHRYRPVPPVAGETLVDRRDMSFKVSSRTSLYALAILGSFSISTIMLVVFERSTGATNKYLEDEIKVPNAFKFYREKASKP